MQSYTSWSCGYFGNIYCIYTKGWIENKEDDEVAGVVQWWCYGGWGSHTQGNITWDHSALWVFYDKWTAGCDA